MSIIDTLIFDRTSEDVRYVQQLNVLTLSEMSTEQLSEYLSSLKGAYNASDFNRVESTVNYLVERLKITGNYINPLTKTSWEINEWVTAKEAIRYLNNISVVKNCLASPSNMPGVPVDLNNFTFEEANDIEKILYMIDTIITNISQAWLYSGDIFSGEV